MNGNYTAVTASGAITGANILLGWQFAENAGSPAAARVLIRDGGAGGAIMADIRLAAGESVGEAYSSPLNVYSETGLYAEVNAGTVRGAVYWA